MAGLLGMLCSGVTSQAGARRGTPGHGMTSCGVVQHAKESVITLTWRGRGGVVVT
jgi:hypothetical protein